MAVTRINNNQITDASGANTQLGINANTKVQNYSITSAKLANNFTYGSDFTITGNLNVNGNSTSIDTTNTTVEDPLLILASNNTNHTVDIGYIGIRDSGANNISLVWKESLNSFVTVFTDSTIGDTTTVNVVSYADFITGNANITGTLTAANVSFTGNVASLTVTGNITAGNITAVQDINSGNLYSSGNLSVTGKVQFPLLAANANGIVFVNSVDGDLTTSLNATITNNGTIGATNLNLSGNVSAQGNVTADIATLASLGNAGGIVYSADGLGTLVNSANVTINADGNVGASNFSTTGNIKGSNVIVTTLGSAPNGIVFAGDIDGTLDNLTTANIDSNGNIAASNFKTGGDVSATGNITTANFFIGDGSLITNLPAGSFISNGTSNVNIAVANGDVKFAVSGTSDVLVVSNTGIDALGYVSAGGNVIGANVSTGGLVSATGNVTGGNILTGGLVSATSTITGGNVETAGYVTATGNVHGGNVLTGGLISATATITGGNVETAGYVTATGNVHGGNIHTDGLITATGTITSAANISGNNLSITNYITAIDVSVTGNIYADKNITTANINTPNVIAANTLTISAGNTGIQFSTNGNIDVGNVWITTLQDPVNDQDAATKAYVDSVAQGIVVHPTSNVATTTDIANVSNVTNVVYNNGTDGVGATLTITTSAQLSIDGVDLSTLVAGSGRVLVKDESATPSVLNDAAWNGIYVVTSTGAGSTVLTRAVDFDGSPGGEIPSAYTFVTQGTVNRNSGWVCTNTSAPTMGTTAILFTQFSQAGNYTAGAGLTLTGSTFSVNTDGVTTAIVSGNVVVKDSANLVTPNIGNATFESFSAVGGTGNIIANNISSAGIVTTVDVIASGNLSATGYVSVGNAYVTSLLDTAIPYANTLGGLVSSNVFTYSSGVLNVGNVSVTGTVIADGNVTGGNILTAGLVSATANITGGNILTAGLVSATANITGGNILTAGLVSVTGNVTANYFIGDGSQLTNLSAGSQIINGNSNVTVSANSNVSFTVNSVANIVVVTDAGIETTGYVTATGNVTGGNIVTSGNVDATSAFVNAGAVLATGRIEAGTTMSAAGNITGGSNVIVTGYVTVTGNVTGGNVLTGGLVSATSTITGGNVETAGYITATGNVTGGNVLTSGLVSATANITGGNVLTGGLVSATGNATAGNILTAGLVSATGDITGNVINGSSANITNNVLAGSLSVTGNVDAGNVFFVDTSTNTASFGSSTQTTNAIVAFNATNSILMPVGNTAQRPSTGVEGMVRWSTTEGALEAYDGTQWATVGAQQFTVIDNEQFNGDGSTVAFTLSTTQTTDSCIVTINGVVQIPTSAYSVSGTTLTFTEAPAVGDVIDVREITTTTTVTGLTAANISLTGNIVATLNPTVPTAALVNSSMTFTLANNTSLIVSVKGTDGTVRSATITLS